MKKYDVVIAGHICLDITPSFPTDLGADAAKVFVPGRLIEVGAPTMSTGGAVSNTGISMLKMGLKTSLMAKIGNDEFGGIIKQICAKINASDGLIEVQGELSSYTCVIAPMGIDRIFFHFPGCNDTFVADDINYEMVSDAKMFHFGYPALMKKFYSDNGEELATMFKRAKECGAITSLDQSYPDETSPAGQADWQTILSKALPYVDIFLPSIEEILLMLNRELFTKRKEEAGGEDLTLTIPIEDVQSLGQKLLDLGVKVALIKCGARGLYLKTASKEALATINCFSDEVLDTWANRELWVAPYKVKVVSATGSGDSAIAAFLAAILNNKNPEDALSLAAYAGAKAVGVADAVSVVIPFSEMENDIANYNEKLKITLPLEWTENNNKIWLGPDDK